MTPIRKHRKERQPWRREKIKKCGVEGRSFPKELFHKEVPGDEGAVLEQHSGQTERKNSFPEEKKERDGEETIDKSPSMIMGYRIIEKRKLESFDEILGESS